MTLYRFMSAKHEILYVGKAKDFEARISGHHHLPQSCYDETYYIEIIDDIPEIEIAFTEQQFIREYKPPYNKQYNDGTEVIPHHFQNVEWKEISTCRGFMFKKELDKARKHLERAIAYKRMKESA